MYEYNARVIRVVDGDTVWLDVDLGCDVHVQMDIRLYGINAPEMSTNEGKVAKAFVEDWLEARPALILHTIKDKREKYGRYLGILSNFAVTEPTLNDRLVAEKLAVPYYP